MKKCLVGLLCLGMAVTATWGQVATLPISESYTTRQDWTALPGWTGVSIGSYADGRAQFDGNNDALTVNFDSSPGTLTFDLKGNTSTTGTAPTQFDVEESANGNSWSPIASIVEEQISTSYNTFGPYTLNSDSRFVRWTYVNKYAFNIGLNNVYITSGGPAEFRVWIDKEDNFTVEQGTEVTFDAETANGVGAPGDYNFVWTTDMDANEHATMHDGFWIKDNASTGTYYATVEVTDLADNTDTATIHFSVVPRAVRYPITIVTNAPANGTVTTTPAGEAAADTTVTVNATPTGGYAVDSIIVTAADMSNVPVAGNTFNMPAQGVTVSVTFAESAAPDVLITFEDGTLSTAYAPNTATLEDGKVWSTDRVVRGNSDSDVKIDTLSARMAPVTGTNALLQLTEAYASPISRISYWVASYGSDNMANVTLTVEVSEDGLQNWTPVETLTGAADITATMTEHVIETVPVNAVYLRFVATAQAASKKRVNLDNIGIYAGSTVFSVVLDKENGFTVEQGTNTVIEAEALNGVAPIDYVWTTDMAAGDYTTYADGFNIKATAATGTYYATVTATDSSSPAQTASNTVTFSVVPQAVKYPITIVTNAPANGTVTTTPAEQAAAGAPVTINATPADGYAVGTITVTAADTSNVPVAGNTFNMPAQGVTVSVTFAESAAPDVLITFEDGTLSTAYAPNTATLEDGKVWSTDRVVRGNSDSDVKIDTLSARMAPVTGTNALLQLTEAYASPISRISYWVASYGSDNMANVTLTVEVSEDGLQNWTPVETLTGAADITATMTEHVIETVPANAVYLRFVATAQAASKKRVNLDNIGIYMGTPAPVFRVEFDKEDNFTVEQGTGATIEAEAFNGVGTITYAWDTDMAAGDYTTYADGFNVKATAALGDYYASVTATDSSSPAQTATNIIHFSVVTPPTPYTITIDATVNGSVTTTPAGQATPNTTVTVNALPSNGFSVATITVTAADTSNVPVNGNTFTMPAQNVTVSVTFAPSAPSDALITFEDGTLPASIDEVGTPVLEDGKVWSTANVKLGSSDDDKKFGAYSAHMHPLYIEDAALQLTQPYDAAITRIRYWVASYGSDNMSNVTLTVGVSTDGTTWTDVDTLIADDITGTLTEHVITTIPENARYLRFVAKTSGALPRSINLDNIAVDMGILIPPIVIVPGGFTFELPGGYSLASVYGADTVVEGDDFPWILLTSPTDYVVEGTTVTIKTDPAQRRLFRIFWQQ